MYLLGNEEKDRKLIKWMWIIFTSFWVIFALFVLWERAHATIYLRYATASQEVVIGQMLDSIDGNTEKAALTINAADIKIWKSGTTTLASKNSGGATYISNGVYYAVLDATDTNTVGSCMIFVHVPEALAWRADCMVLPSQVYDSMVTGSDLLQVDLANIDNAALGTHAAGHIPADERYLAGYASQGDSSGYVKISSGTGTGQLDLTNGRPGIDWTKVSNPTSTVGLTNTTFSSTQTVASVTGSVGSVAGNVAGSCASVTTINDKSGYRLSATGVDDIFDEIVEGSLTLRHMLRVYQAVLAGKSSGMGTSEIKFHDNAGTGHRVTATMDANHNRTAVIIDGE